MLEECGVEVEFVDYHPGKCILPSKEATGMKKKSTKKGLEILRMKGRLRDKVQFWKYKKIMPERIIRYWDWKRYIIILETGSAGDRK